MSAPRYSFAPIDAMFPEAVGRRGWSNTDEDVENIAPIHECLGVSRNTVNGWRHNGLSTMAADKLAVSLGLNPVDLWPSWYDDAALEPTCGECDEPLSEGRTYCSPEHKAEARRRRQRVAA